MTEKRTARTRELLREQGLDACVFLHPPNLRYLCGFTGSDGALVVAGGKECFLTDSRYTTQARAQVRAGEVRQYSVKADGIASLLGEWRTARIGFEAGTLPVASFEQLREKSPAGAEWVPLEKEILSLRGVKDGEEIGALKQAASLNAEAFAEVLPLIRPGTEERELALALEFSLKRRGGEEKAFDFIVASGPRGALPHGIASEKRIGSGELVTIDFGTRFQGYHSDETVTVAVGEVPERLLEVFRTVQEAQKRAMAAVRPGVDLKEVDKVARDLISERGFGEYFGHGLGHGVGLEVHEYPTLSPRSGETAREGMVFTIEPGIYIPELGGVRLEEMVQVTADGCRPLTRIPKDLRVLPAD